MSAPRSHQGRTWSALAEIGRRLRNTSGFASPEGCSLFHTGTQTAITIWAGGVVTNKTTGLQLWQSESADRGASSRRRRDCHCDDDPTFFHPCLNAY